MNEHVIATWDGFWTDSAHWLTSQVGVTVICMSILIWAIFAFVRFYRRIVPIISQVNAGLAEIQAYEGEQGFANGFEAFNEKMLSNPVLRHAWSEYGETLIKDPELIPLAIRNTRAASDYFSRGNVISDRLNLRFYSALPNLLTGTGILGTFVGLVAGIGLASGGLAADDADKVKEALQQLLHGASLAFFTSIAGLITSIFFFWAEKHWIHKLGNSLRRWHDELESRLLRVTDESLMTDQLSVARQQTVILTQFTQDLAFQIANAFQEQMSASMGPVMGRILEAVEGLRGDQSKRNDDVMQQMLEKFSDSLTGAAGQELSALGTTLQSLNDKLTGQIGHLSERQREIDEASVKAQHDFAKVVKWSTGQMQESIGEALKQIVDKIGGMVGELAGDLRSAAQEAADRLSELSRRFNESIVAVNQALDGATGLTENYQLLLSESSDAVSSMNQAASAMSGVVEPIGQAASEIKSTAEAMASVSQSTESSVASLSQVLDTLASMQDEVKTTWATYATRFESVDESLGKVFAELSTGLESYTEQVKTFVSELDQHTGSIVSDLASANAELTSSVEELSETLGRNR